MTQIGLINLCVAIINQAATDYRKVLKKGDQGQVTKYEIESFFRSTYYKSLTNVDGEWLLRKLQEEILENKERKV